VFFELFAILGLWNSRDHGYGHSPPELDFDNAATKAHMKASMKALKETFGNHVAMAMAMVGQDPILAMLQQLS
jgi:hypothetical protein